MSKMLSGAWLDTAPGIGLARQRPQPDALKTRPRLRWVETDAGRVRVRHQPGPPQGPRLMFGADGPNAIEHYDALLEALGGRADVVIFDPPGTGASRPASGFDFTVEAFTRVSEQLLEAFGPRVLIFPCYLGFVAQQVARQRPELVRAVITPQTSSWSDLQVWADTVDPKRLLRAPILGQLLIAARRDQVIQGWYGASTGDKAHRAPFIKAAQESIKAQGCFCLATLMQGYERSAVAPPRPLPVPHALVWGARDRTHKRSDPATAYPGAALVRFDQCGHSPELEAPQAFISWLLDWLKEQP